MYLKQAVCKRRFLHRGLCLCLLGMRLDIRTHEHSFSCSQHTGPMHGTCDMPTSTHREKGRAGGRAGFCSGACAYVGSLFSVQKRERPSPIIGDCRRESGLRPNAVKGVKQGEGRSPTRTLRTHACLHKESVPPTVFLLTRVTGTVWILRESVPMIVANVVPAPRAPATTC
jgi:hypothetical protein